jgi:hypothetical protein
MDVPIMSYVTWVPVDPVDVVRLVEVVDRPRIAVLVVVDASALEEHDAELSSTFAVW